MATFKAKFRKYWCDYYSEYTEIRTSSIDEILEYVYKTHSRTKSLAVKMGNDD